MRNIISIANSFILDNHIRPLPLRFNDLTRICKKLRYSVFSYAEAAETIRALGIESYTEHPAVTVRYANQKFIFFDEKQSTGTRLFAIAHEIGHIVLQHNYCGAVGYTQSDNVQELEADTFAYQLLAPLCLLRALHVTDTRDIESCSLLDHDRAKKVHKALQHYHEQPHDKEIIRAYGIVQPRRKLDFAFLLILLVVLITAATIVVRELPKQNSPAETTQNFFAQLRDKQPETTARFDLQAATPSPEQSETVYITRSGERYHKQNCYHIKNRTVTAISLSDAVEDGYTACKSCYK